MASIFPEGRTRSKSTLPEALIEFSRSPFKDARQRNRRMETEGREREAEEVEEDEMNLSPKKDFQLGDKRSPSPSPSTDWPRSKRLKPSPAGSDAENNTAPSLAHSRHVSDSNILTKSNRKRSATTSKPKSSSNTLTRQQSPPLAQKERARSVPVFPSFRDFPIVDIRDIPTSPTRRSPTRLEPKLRIVSKTLVPQSQTLESIPDEALPEREAAAESIGIDSVAATLDVVTAQTATPAQRNAVADPSSPLTPLPETSPCKKPAETTEDPSTGLGQDLFGSYVPNDINKLPESGATINPSRLRSRLPRPTNATASSSKPNQASHASKADIGKSALTVQKPKPQRNAFDVLMPKSGSKGKPAEKGKSVAPVTTLVAQGKDRVDGNVANGKKDTKGKGKASAEIEVEPVKTSTVKGKMKPRAKPPAKPVVPLVLEDEVDESTNEPPRGDEAVVYPLEALPSRGSPLLDYGPLPPKSSSPVYSPEVDEGMVGIEDGVLRMDDVEMQEDDPFSVEPDRAMDDNGSSMPVLEGTLEDPIPRVPSPLFSDVASASPSPLFSEPDEQNSGPNQDVHQKPEVTDAMDIVPSMDVVTDSPVQPFPKPAPKAKKPSVQAAPRMTRSASSKGPTTTTETLKKYARKAGKKAKAKAVSAPLPHTESVLDSTVASSQPSASLDETVPADPHTAYFDPQSLPVNDYEAESLSELSDLPDDYGYDDVEVPLKGDPTEDVEMQEPLSMDAGPEVAPTKSTSTKSSSKRKSTIPQTPPKERSRRTRKSGDSLPEGSPASFAVVQPSEVATASTSTEKTTPSARATRSSLGRSSGLPVLKTPARSHTTSFISPGPKGTRPGSAPSSPTKLELSRSFSYKPVSHLVKGETKALGELQRALAKLKKPKPEWPARPNTSMGFNPEDPDSSMELDPRSTGGNKSSTIGLGRPSTTSKVPSSSSNAEASSSKSSVPSFANKALVQKQISMFMAPGTGPGLKKPAIMRGGRSEQSGTGNRFALNVGPGSLGSRKKVSQVTKLPSIVASPVKGGATRMAGDNDIEMGDITMADISMSSNHADMDISELSSDKSTAGSSKNRSMLSQSLSALPTQTAGLMGPPPLPTSPPRRAGLRSSSSSYPSGSSRPQAPAKFVPESYILEGCTVFVDVWMSDGQDTSSLYIEIAKNMGARIVKSIGPQCTHIVYTNGRPRTVENYFAMDEERRPKAVGASWLKDCQESASRLDEDQYIVDLEEHRPSILNNMITDKGEKPKHKRRQSYIPKFCVDDESEYGGDVSMDGSNTSMVDDDLPPLERARLRQSMILASSTRK